LNGILLLTLYIQPGSSRQPSENHHILSPLHVFEKFNF